jgi:hypothetical protein
MKLTCGVEEFTKVTPATLGPSGAVAITILSLLVSRKETDPEGDAVRPSVARTLASNRYFPRLPVLANVVAVRETDVPETDRGNGLDSLAL